MSRLALVRLAAPLRDARELHRLMPRRPQRGGSRRAAHARTCPGYLHPAILPLPMLQLIQTQKAAVTMIIFITTYFASLTVGRLLKHRAGVPLGVLFQLFCLTLAFYAAVWFYGVQANWRNHVGAALFV